MTSPMPAESNPLVTTEPTVDPDPEQVEQSEPRSRQTAELIARQEAAALRRAR
jgi:hypothetical protein